MSSMPLFMAERALPIRPASMLNVPCAPAVPWGCSALSGDRSPRVSALIWFVSGQLVDVSTATTLHAETLQFRGNMENVVPRLAAILWRRMHEDE